MVDQRLIRVPGLDLGVDLDEFQPSSDVLTRRVPIPTNSGSDGEERYPKGSKEPN